MTDVAPTARPRTRAPRTSPERRRAQIVEAAIAVFGQQGYRQGSLKAVADEVGLTIQGLLHYFPTKEQLLLTTLEQRNALTQAKLDEAIEAEGALGACRFVLRRNRDDPGFMRLFVTLAAEATDPEHPAHEYFLRRYETMHAQFAEHLRSEAARGRIAAGVDPGAAAASLIALMDGLQLQALHRPAMDMLDTFEQATRHLRAEP
ncbi:TetR/AcrR family transcriptional regulator [Kitasatospora sp. SUK 42]|uniref:TetR/AcrR family transcriptional regulator n=1 Tax=Kitasatospora sp. SUK 42 TaxID=1588882 RepID=UPI0018CB4EF9|nr:TetR/AcrR family transcriptional regulator [Kitasatospora sp. SUK 42]MBV2155051.1 TetR/AcrR family transcriptional regulator [Kitasatospora sp. SUK 42]